MAKDIILDPELRDRLRTGSRAVRRTVEANFGPEGRNTIREQTYDLPLVANTGRRVLQELAVKDPGENLAAALVRDAGLKVAGECGDGAIATVLLADSMLAEGQKLIAAGYDPMGLRKGVHRALPLVPGLLEKIALPLEEVTLEKFAAATAKNPEVSENVVKAFETVGADGVITVQDTQGRDTVLHLWDGVRYDYGLLSMSFATDGERKRAVLSEPYVLLSNVKIKSLQDIRKILEDVIRTGSSLLIIASDMDEEVQKILAANVVRGGLKVVVAKAPGFGDTRRRNMLALAAKIGSLIFEENTGRELRDCGLEFCCQIGRAEVNKDETILQGFRQTSEEMVAILRKHTLSQLDKTTDPDEREKLQITMSILNGKTAEILVGAVVEYEMFEKKYLYENTVRTVQNAARSGCVPGAGSTWLYLARELDAASADLPETERLGMRCLCGALRELVKTLAENAGQDGGTVLSRLEGEQDPYRGWDVLAGRVTDLREQGILTPRNTVETIVRVAAETAASLWTTGAAVLESGK